MVRSVFAAGFVVLAVIGARSDGAQAPSRSVWSGVYSTEQAERGRKLYVRDCQRCHGDTLLGGEGGPALSGEEFLTAWKARTAAELFELIQTTMPEETPGSLSSRQYSDVLAYVFKENEFPAGMEELPSDPAALRAVLLEPKPDGTR
jgi:mono/diheme cytochrome c family protein